MWYAFEPRLSSYGIYSAADCFHGHVRQILQYRFALHVDPFPASQTLGWMFRSQSLELLVGRLCRPDMSLCLPTIATAFLGGKFPAVFDGVADGSAFWLGAHS